MKKIINTKNAPAPIGPYNQAVLKGNMLFTSGQIAIDPMTGDLDDQDIRTETKRVMENLKAVLSEVDMNFDHVLKTTIYLTSMSNFMAINEVYASYFNDDTAPARETVEVSNLPKGLSIEISMIASR